MSSTSDQVPGLVTVDQLSRAWGVKPATLRSWARKGRIRSIKIGNTLLFRIADLQAIVDGAEPAREPESPATVKVLPTGITRNRG